MNQTRMLKVFFFLAVKPYYSFPIRYSFSMDEKEAEARPLMGTIFLVVIKCVFYL